MAQFITLTSARGNPQRFNAEGIMAYSAHQHDEDRCDQAGMDPCQGKSDVYLYYASGILMVRETPEEIDRLVQPLRTRT